MALSYESYKKTIDSFLIDPYNENIFIIITNGPYFLLEFFVNLATTIFEKEKNSLIQITNEEIKKLIEEEIKKEKLEISPLINNLIMDRDKLYENIFAFYELFYKLRSKKIKHCLLYIGEESETEYEDSLIKIAKINHKEFAYDDIYIIYKIKNLIKELHKLNTKFIGILENFGKQIILHLEKNKKDKLKEIFRPIRLKEKDKIKVKFYLLDNKNFLEKAIQSNGLVLYDIQYLNEENMFKAVDDVKNIDYKVIIFISTININNYFLNLYPKRYYGGKLLYSYYNLEEKDIEEIVEIVLSDLTDDFIKKNCCSSPKVQKYSFELNGILNYKMLSVKIKKELEIELGEEQMKELLDLNFDPKEKENFFKDIINNINTLNEFIELNNLKENIESLKKQYEERILLLEENIKASMLYDYIYVSLIPNIKFQEALKLYKNIK